ALAAATTGLALARTDTATNADTELVGTGIVTKFIQTGHMIDSLLLADNADEMRKLVDHAAHFGRIDQLALFVHLVEPETDQSRALHLVTTDRRTDLLNNKSFLLSHDLSPDRRSSFD